MLLGIFQFNAEEIMESTKVFEIKVFIEALNEVRKQWNIIVGDDNIIYIHKQKYYVSTLAINK